MKDGRDEKEGRKEKEQERSNREGEKMRNRSENGVIESRKGTGSEREVEQRPIFVPSALQPYVAAFSLSLSPAVIFVMSECENHPS